MKNTTLSPPLNDTATFLNLSTVDILGQTILGCAGLSCALQDVCTILRPSSLDISSHLLSCAHQKCLLEDRIAPGLRDSDS